MSKKHIKGFRGDGLENFFINRGYGKTVAKKSAIVINEYGQRLTVNNKIAKSIRNLSRKKTVMQERSIAELLSRKKILTRSKINAQIRQQKQHDFESFKKSAFDQYNKTICRKDFENHEITAYLQNLEVKQSTFTLSDEKAIDQVYSWLRNTVFKDLYTFGLFSLSSTVVSTSDLVKVYDLGLTLTDSKFIAMPCSLSKVEWQTVFNPETIQSSMLCTAINAISITLRVSVSRTSTSQEYKTTSGLWIEVVQTRVKPPVPYQI